MTSSDARQSVTLLLHADQPGDSHRRMAQLLPLIYEQMRQIARGHLAREHERYSLCTTGLVHEAYLKLVDDENVSSRGKAYFFAAVAQTMRRIIVDHARARRQLKRGGDVHITSFDDKEIAVADLLAQVIELDAALEQLAKMSERQVRVVECRVFGGLDVQQTADSLEISARTVKRDWAVARAWLIKTLQDSDQI